jgi:energy-converting hydrogenase Eha subunit B
MIANFLILLMVFTAIAWLAVVYIDIFVGLFDKG